MNYISNYVFDNKSHFNIFVPDVLNTPIGKVLRHNWLKNEKMYSDMNNILQTDIIENDTLFDFNKYYDFAEYPNVNKNGYEYYY
jgi:hypothetical protein